MASFKVSDNCPDGALVGNSATSKVGFFGATPVVQQTAPSLITLSTTGDSAADATAFRNAINTLISDSTNLGLMA